MTVLFMLLRILLISFVVDGYFWGWGGHYGKHFCTCGWQYGGKCKLSCDRGEYIFGPIPCGHGAYGTCCAPELPCNMVGGKCCYGGCIPASATFNARCPRASQTCCLRTPAPFPTNYTPPTIPQSPSNRQCPAGRRLTSRITGGYPVNSPCQWPWMVSLRLGTLTTPSNPICAGILLSSNKVLTTAGCALGNRIIVTLNEKNIQEYGEAGEINIQVSSQVVHEDFNPNILPREIQAADLAILTLEEHVSMTTCVMPACLPLATEDDPVNRRCYIAGWGINEVEDGRLREANVNINSRYLCRLMGGFTANISFPEDKLCSAFSDADGCWGDNGGMLVCEDSEGVWSLFGIISAFSCSRGLPTLYTSIQDHRDWINKHI